MGDSRLQTLLVLPGTRIRDVMQCIDAGTVEIALVVDDDGRLLGTVSDGDIRRALLAGATLADPVDPFVHRDPITVESEAGRAAALDLMRARRVAQIPEVDSDGHLLGLHVLQEIIGGEPIPNWAVILAGGRGSRLGDLTDSTPKPMLQVAGRPILERLVLHLVGSGIRRVYLSVGYLADQIEHHFGDGATFGCEIHYLREAPDQPLGTGGPLRLLLDEADGPDAPVLVMNGDLVTSFSVSGILEAHSRADAVMTVGLRDYSHDVPFGVVETDERSRIGSIEEKPRLTWPVNAGVYVVEPRLLHRLPSRRTYPITDLARTCLANDEPVLGWPLEGDWHDVGRPSELALARGET